MNGGPLWLLIINFIVWSGIAVYLYYLDRKISHLEEKGEGREDEK